MSKDEIEIFIENLRNNNFSQVETIKMVMEKFELSLFDADKYVLNSKSWKSAKIETEEIRDLFDNELGNK